jgi:hypothetical protein
LHHTVTFVFTEELLAGFFKFFSQFDFKANALSIRNGSIIPVAKITLDNTINENLNTQARIKFLNLFFI